MNYFRLFVIVLFALSGQYCTAQSSEETAHNKGREAIELMDNGEIEKSIKLLEEAIKLDPKNIIYPYEIAYAHYINKDYKAAIKKLEVLSKRSDSYDLIYQLLGNSYSMDGQREKAIKTYENGLEKFPKSGKLHLERGNMELFAEQYDEALHYYEKGIMAEPMFPSNYYWAAKLYCSSTEEVWGMIYGEIFMNLERNSKRTVEISKLLYDIYKREIEFTGDTSFSVSFSQNATINVNDLTDTANFRLPFGVGVYEPTLMLSMLSVNTININTLDKIRSEFIDNYYNNKHNVKYPNVLFSYQKKIKDAGHIEAYNHWILMQGDVDEFDKWHAQNVMKFEKFGKWFKDNKLNIDDTNKFHSGLY